MLACQAGVRTQHVVQQAGDVTAAVAGPVDHENDVETVRLDVPRSRAELQLGRERTVRGHQLGKKLAPHALLGVDHRALRERQQRRDLRRVLEGADVDGFQPAVPGEHEGAQVGARRGDGNDVAMRRPPAQHRGTPARLPAFLDRPAQTRRKGWDR